MNGVELSAPALFLAGIAASPHCSLMCGPLHLAQLRGGGALAPRAFWLHGGRVLGYAGLGAIAGALGAELMPLLPGVAYGNAVRTAAALMMVVLALVLLRPSPSLPCGRHRPPPAPGGMLLRGLASALVPCGMLYAMLLLATFSAQAPAGALLMTAFGLGTVPLTLGGTWALRRMSLSPQRLRKGAALALLGLSGLSLLSIWSADEVLGWCRALWP